MNKLTQILISLSLIVFLAFSFRITAFENSVDKKFLSEYEINEKLTVDISQLLADMKQIESSSKQSKIKITKTLRYKTHELTKEAKTDIERVYLLHKFVFENISYRDIPGVLDSFETLEKMEGDCIDKAILLSSMLNVVGLENFIAETRTSNYVNHAYVIVRINDKWLAIDPTASFLETPDLNIKEVYNTRLRYTL